MHVPCFAFGCTSNGNEEDRALIRKQMLHDLANYVIEPFLQEFAQQAIALQEAARVFEQIDHVEALITNQPATLKTTVATNPDALMPEKTTWCSVHTGFVTHLRPGWQFAGMEIDEAR